MHEDALQSRTVIARRARALAWWCIVAIVVAVPVITTNPTIVGIGSHPLTVDQAELPRAIALAVLSWLSLAAWGVSEVAKPAGARWSVAWALLIGFVVLATASALFSRHQQIVYVGRWFHYEGLMQLWVYATACFVAAQTVTGRRLTTLVRAGAITGTVLSVYGMLQVVGLDPANWLVITFPLKRAFATWNNPDFFGAYLIFPFAFSIAMSFGDSSRRWRIAGGCMAVVTGLAVAATITRGAWITALLVVAFALVTLARRGHAWKRVLAGAVLFVVVAGAGVNIASGNILLTRLQRTATEAMSGRPLIWKNTLTYALEAPTLGTGPDTFAVTSLAHLVEQRGAAPDDPHNMVLYLLVTVGVPATLAILTFGGLVLVRSTRLVFAQDERGGLALSAAWWAAAAYGVYLAAGVSIAASTTLMFVCLGFLVASAAKRVRVPPLALWGVAIIAIVLVGTSVWLGARGLVADNAYYQARTAAREGGDRLGWAERAVELNPWNGAYLRELSEARAAEGQQK